MDVVFCVEGWDALVLEQDLPPEWMPVHTEAGIRVSVPGEVIDQWLTLR